MRVVIDTNVLVSAAWVGFEQGWPTQIVRAVLTGRLTGHHDDRILSERRRVAQYKHVRARVPAESFLRVLQALEVIEEHVDAERYAEPLPDESDRPFVEIARTAAAVLVTGNVRHFPDSIGIEVLTPAQAAARLLGS